MIHLFNIGGSTWWNEMVSYSWYTHNSEPMRWKMKLSVTSHETIGWNYYTITKAYTKLPRNRCTENHNMVIFRALFAEASLHKKGETADFFTVHMLSISEIVVMSPPTLRNGTVSKKSSSRSCRYIHVSHHIPLKKPQNWGDSQMKAFFWQLSCCSLMSCSAALAWPCCSASSASLDRLIFRTAMLWCDVVVFSATTFLVV
jgi:hypothetical protein